MCSASVCGIVVAALPLTELCSSVFYRKETVHIVFFLIFINRFKSMNEDAIFRLDFDHLLNQELIIKPGENSAEISVNVTEDILPENNETFLLTLMSLDKVTIISSGSARITILNNGKTYAIVPISVLDIIIQLLAIYADKPLLYNPYRHLNYSGYYENRI